MVTVSDTTYKDYIIRLRFSTNRGGFYKIFKVDDLKWFNLRERGWVFILPEEALIKAKNYIDEFPKQLEEKYQKMKSYKRINHV